MQVDFNMKDLAPFIDGIQEAVKEESDKQELQFEPEYVTLRQELYNKAIIDLMATIEDQLRREFNVR